jgi:hypothetical protein
VGLDGFELGVALQPIVPALKETIAFALSDQHSVEMAA